MRITFGDPVRGDPSTKSLLPSAGRVFFVFPLSSEKFVFESKRVSFVFQLRGKTKNSRRVRYI
jgi:hypothetical protein